MRAGDFSEAAAELRITQPSVSQAVGRIKRGFDTALIARSHGEGEPVPTLLAGRLRPASGVRCRSWMRPQTRSSRSKAADQSA